MSSLYSVLLNWNYIVVNMLMMAGLYIIISNQNFIKKLVGLPHVLILTAIVVGVATNALGLALVVRIHEAFDSIEEKKLLALKIEDGHQENEQKDDKL